MNKYNKEILAEMKIAYPLLDIENMRDDELRTVYCNFVYMKKSK